MADDDKTPKPAPDDDAWIERVVDLAGHLGFNKMRLRWKLMRWQNGRRKAARRSEQVVAHITYAHKTCPECGAVQDNSEAVCTRCGAKLGARGFQMLSRIGLAVPVAISMSTLLALAILAVYARSWVAAGGGLAAPSGHLLVELGGRWAPAMSDEPWRLVTAMFLHAGLWHLLFNLLAIASVGPRIEELYGRAAMLALFIVTGVLANLAVLQIGTPGVGIGASGGVMGLIGAAAAAGHRSGTSYGHAVRDAMLKWIAYTFLFGYMVHADNWAHLFGALGGIAFGLAVKPAAWMRHSLRVVRGVVGAIGLAATIAAVAIILSRTATPLDEPETHEAQGAPPASLTDYIEICTKLYAGDSQAALDAARRVVLAGRDPAIPFDLEPALTKMCDGLQQLRDECKAPDPRLDVATALGQRETCEAYQPAFYALPVRRYERHPTDDDLGGR